MPQKKAVQVKPRQWCSISRASFAKLAQGEDAQWERTEVLGLLFIWRAISAIIAGIICGAAPFTGWVPFATFAALSFLLAKMFYGGVMKIDEEEWGGLVGYGQLLVDGAPLSLSAFCVSWIITYSTKYF